MRDCSLSQRLVGFLGLAVVSALVLTACGTTTGSGSVGIERRQMLLVSSEEMNQGARLQYAKMMKEAGAKGALNRDSRQTERVRRIASRIIPHTVVFRADAPKWNWEVNVLASSAVNAWCMPGGKIAFYTGILEKLDLTDDEAAAVMGHEIAHALREHSRERASQMLASQAVIGVGAAILGIGQAGVDLGNMVAQVTFNLPNSRVQESEADRMGVELAARAGYDPRAAIALWQKMARLGSNGPEFLSTHPSPATRIADLEIHAAKVMPLYEQARARLGLLRGSSGPVAAF